MQREYADGVRLVELGELRDESSLVDAVAAALGVRDHSARPLRDGPGRSSSRRGELLLVLDNCEHVVDAVAELAETLFGHARGCGYWPPAVNPSVIGGEAVLRVPPLASPIPSGSRRCEGCPNTMR